MKKLQFTLIAILFFLAGYTQPDSLKINRPLKNIAVKDTSVRMIKELPQQPATTTPVLVTTTTIMTPVLTAVFPVEYNIGTGIAKVTDPAIGLAMQGMSDDKQKTTGVETDLFARAFIIQHISSGKRVILLNADIWACTHALKTEVVRQLQAAYGNTYTMENVLLSGTHNHSGPGGYSYYYLYNHSIKGFDKHNFQCIVAGMVQAIQKAHANLGPGRIYVNSGEIADCGRNRSIVAYNNNPQAERNSYSSTTDKEMLLLKFVKDNGSKQTPVGVLSWFGIHPTDHGQKNTKVSSDNKGYASYLFEQSMATNPEKFVAAFANASAGDVSGNVEYGRIPNGTDDLSHVQAHGRRQYDKAKELYNAATVEVRGPVEFRHRFVDMVAKTGAPGSLGLSMFAGSTEDSDPGSGLKEGIVEGSVLATERVIQGGIGAAFGLASGVPYATAANLTSAEVQYQLPKPITLAPGFTREGKVPLVPTILPVQLFRIGQVAVAGIPAEFTTMAGRRLKKALLEELTPAGVAYIAPNTYANDYSQYVTTAEEYQKQHYEGASTLYGPNTLNAYLGEYRALAAAIRSGSSVAQGPYPPDLSGQSKKLPRITIRNTTAQNQTLFFYNFDDGWMLAEFYKTTIPAYADVYFNLTDFLGRTKAKVVLNGVKNNAPQFSTDQMIEIGSNNSLQVKAYTPPPR